MLAMKIKWARFVVTFYVALSLAFLPMLTQQAMAGHHVNEAVNVSATASSQEHSSAQSGSCAEQSDTQSADKQMNCCDMNCSGFAAFEATEVPSVQLRIADHFEIDAEQLTSRIVFGLRRPPRA